jgi:hypothetical protein
MHAADARLFVPLDELCYDADGSRSCHPSPDGVLSPILRRLMRSKLLTGLGLFSTACGRLAPNDRRAAISRELDAVVLSQVHLFGLIDAVEPSALTARKNCNLRFGGTLSPQAMDSRSDGALSRVLLLTKIRAARRHV